MSSILIIDLETHNIPYYGLVASPHCPDNYIVESGWRIDRKNADGTTCVGEIKSRRFPSKEDFLSAPPRSWLELPDDCWLIVAHNAAYEIQWFLSHARTEFEAFLRRGGRVFCTSHGEYLCTDQTSLYPSLDETAPKYGGTHKVDGIKLLWEQGVLTSEIDPILLHEYLAGPNGDVANTALCFYGQCATLTKQGKFPMVWERMDALLAFAYCEWFGMYVNMPVAKANQAVQEQEIKRLKEVLVQYMPEDLPPEVEFNWGSDFHMSALLYGGPLKYRKKVHYDEPTYVKADAYQLHEHSAPYFSEEDGCWVDPLDGKTYCSVDAYDGLYAAQRLSPADLVIYKAGKNKGQLKVFRANTTELRMKWGEAVFQMPGLCSIQRLPAYLQDKYGERGEFRQARTLCDGSPVYSSSGDAMMGLAAQGFEWAKNINDLNALEKDTGTYYLREELDDDGNVVKQSGMLQYVIPDKPDGSGIIHHRLNTSATVTGRLSASNPNLQNLPRDSAVKQMFTSRYGPNGVIIEVDYSALEVVMGVVHSGDMELLRLLQAGTDMHCYRLAYQQAMPYEEVLELCHNETGAEYSKWKKLRTDIKAPSFAAQYGASAAGIAFATGCTVEFAQAFLDNEAKMFPATAKFRDVIRESVERTGMEQGNLYREVADDGSIRLYRRGYWASPAGMRYSFRQVPVWKPRADGRGKEQVLDYKETQLANYWCQGEAFFLMAVAFGMILRHMLANNWYDGQVCLITNVHDAAYLDAANPEVGREAALAVKHIMETARERILQLWPNYGHLAVVPFPAAAEMGHNMGAKHHVE